MAFKPILAATIAFLLSFVILGCVFVFLALAFFGASTGSSSELNIALLVAGALLLTISSWFAFFVNRRVNAVLAGTFVKPVNEENIIKHRFFLGCSLFGLVLLLKGLLMLDVPLLLRHETAQGWIIGVSVEPYRHSFRSFHRTTASYAYSDANGVRYERTAKSSTLGYESRGDRFTVLYDPNNPRRHRALTLWGQLDSLVLISLGLLVGVGSALQGRRIKRLMAETQRGYSA